MKNRGKIIFWKTRLHPQGKVARRILFLVTYLRFTIREATNFGSRNMKNHRFFDHFLRFIIRERTHFRTQKRVKIITFGTSKLVASRMINLVKWIQKYVKMVFIEPQAAHARTDASTHGHVDEHQILRPLHNRPSGNHGDPNGST